MRRRARIYASCGIAGGRGAPSWSGSRSPRSSGE
jgi:hypothetical protein